MKQIRVTILFLNLTSLTIFASDSAKTMPVFFFRNVNATNSETSFIMETPRVKATFRNDAVVYTIHGVETELRFPGSNPRVYIEPLDPMPAKVNLLLGDRHAWRTNVETFGRLTYRELYAGIDLTYSGANGQAKPEFIVRPHADPSRIRLFYPNSTRISIDSSGDLVVADAASELREERPAIYQETSTGRVFVHGKYCIIDDHTAGFEIEPYDVERTLVIDPVVSYSTYFGGGLTGAVTGVAADSTGAVYVTGWTESIDLPISGAIQSANRGGVDAFVAKFTAAGTSLLYATYIGGNGDDRAAAIAVDSSGQAYVTGSTASANFPLVSSARSVLGGGREGFALKLNASGSALIYSTFLGGSGWDQGTAIAVDGSGNAYIAGDTQSADFRVVGPAQPSFGGQTDAFVTKLSPAGAIAYSTFLGGSGTEHAGGIAVDAAGNAYVAGGTYSTDFPVTSSAFQRNNAGGQDAFVTKLNSTGSGIVYSTYLGGSGGTQAMSEQANAVAVDSSGNAYVAGVTSSANFPATFGALRTTVNGLQDAFITKLNASGSGLTYSTYLGGSTSNWATGIAVDSTGNAYVTGSTSSVDFPQASSLQSFAGFYDAFVSELNPAGNGLVYSTLYGGSGSDSANAIALGSNGAIYVGGQTSSADFPMRSAMKSTYIGFATGWVISFGGSGTTANNPPSVVSGSPTSSTTASQTFTFVARDPDGYGDIYRIYFLVNPNSTIPANTCHGYYDTSTNAFYLYNDGLTVAQGPLTPGSSASLQNSQCTLNGTGSTIVSTTGTDITLTTGLTLSSAYGASAKNVYLWVKDKESHDTGWIQTGSWIPSVSNNNFPSVVSGSPATVTTTSQTFTFVARDIDGFADIYRIYFLVNPTSSIPANTCHGFFDRSSNGFYLYNDGLTVAQGPLSASSTLQNSQCSLIGSGSAVISASGTDITLTIGLAISASYASTPQNVYLWVKDAEGHDTGWIQTGTWTVQATGNNPPSVVSGSPAATSTQSQTFTFVGRDPDGANDIYRIYFLVNPTASIPANTCHGFYDRPTNKFYLYNDGLTVQQGPLSSSSTLQNSQCTLNGSTTALVSASGTDVTLTIGLTLSSSYAATPQKVYLWVKDAEGRDTGWIQTGTWTVQAAGNNPPSVVSGSPNTSSAQTQTFTFVARDVDGASDIYRIYFLVNPTANIPANTCHGFYDYSTNSFFLYNDGLTVLQGPLSSSSTLQNSQCTLIGSATSFVSSTGTDVTLTIELKLSNSYMLIPQNVYLWVKDKENHDTGWIQTGTWNP